MSEKKKIFYGSDIKLKINVDFGADVDINNTDFYVMLYCGNKSIKLLKNQLVKIDKNNYIACVKSPDTTRGSIDVEVCASLIDNDFSDNIHTVVSRVNTGVVII